MIGFASAIHYREHLEPLGIEITNRRPVGHTHVVVASRVDARRMEPVTTAQVCVVEHGAGQRYHIDAGGVETPHPNVTLFLAPSERVAVQSQHLFPNAECVAVGSPRVEHLASLPSVPEKIVVAFHWNSPVAPEARSAWTHYTGSLPALKDTFGDRLLGHAHPAIASKLKPWFWRNNVVWEPSWEQCVRQAACLVVDNSSIMWEACALGIPVVVLNAPWYRRDVDFGLRFWEWADVGPQVEAVRELPAAVQQVLVDDWWADRRADAAGFVYGQIGGSGDRARQALDNWAGECDNGD